MSSSPWAQGKRDGMQRRPEAPIERPAPHHGDPENSTLELPNVAQFSPGSQGATQVPLPPGSPLTFPGPGAGIQMEASEIAGLNLEFLTSSECCTKVAAWGKPTLGPWPWLLAHSQAPLPFPPPAPLSMCRAAPSKGVPIPACTSNFQLQLPETATPWLPVGPGQPQDRW